MAVVTLVGPRTRAATCSKAGCSCGDDEVPLALINNHTSTECGRRASRQLPKNFDSLFDGEDHIRALSKDTASADLTLHVAMIEYTANRIAEVQAIIDEIERRGGLAAR